MEKISEMIQRLCPEGVEWKTLGEILTIKAGGDVPVGTIKGQRFPTESCPYPVYSNGQEESALYGFSSEYRNANDAITVSARGSIGFHAVRRGKFTPIVRLITMEPISEANIYYINYALYNVDILGSQGGIPQLTVPMVKNISIPLPPLPIQQEIVRILDSFTSLITNLETELASRQKQYEYYRNKLLTFDENDETVEWKTLGEIGTVVRGNGLQKSDFSEEGVGCVHYGQIYTRLGFSIDKTLTFVPEDLAEKLTQVEPGNLIIACTSENVEDVCKSVVWLGSETIVTGGHACVFKHNENPKYVGYCFLTNNFFDQKQKYAYGAKVIDIRTEKLALIKIPVPSKERQQEIVSTLDTFESLIANIKQELDARKKQYEYYREKLLTFE